MALALAGVFFLFLGIFLIYQDRPKKKKKCSETCPGQIIDVIRKDDSVYHGERVEYAISYYPVFSYEVGGEKIRSQLYFGSDKPAAFQKGDHYTVHYNPENPTDFYVIVTNRGKTAGIICMIVGLLILCIP